MDPASLSNLDPKLRETYERVMGTSTPAAAGPSPLPSTPTDANSAPKPSDTATTPSSSASPLPDPLADPAGAAPAPGDGLSMPPVMATPFAQEQQPETVTISQPLPNPTAMNQINKPHGHAGLIKIFYILGAVVFFFIYVFFWVKIFNIKLF